MADQDKVQEKDWVKKPKIKTDQLTIGDLKALIVGTDPFDIAFEKLTIDEALALAKARVEGLYTLFFSVKS